MALSWPAKDPDEVADYTVHWAENPLTGEQGRTYGDPIFSSDWTVPVGIINEEEDFDDDTTTIWLSGGTIGTTYELLNRIVTVGGRTFDQTVKLKIKTR